MDFILRKVEEPRPPSRSRVATAFFVAGLLVLPATIVSLLGIRLTAADAHGTRELRGDIGVLSAITIALAFQFRSFLRGLLG